MLKKATFVALTAIFIVGAVLLALFIAAPGVVDPLFPLFAR